MRGTRRTYKDAKRNMIRAILITWGFAFAVALLNLSMLLPLAFPPLIWLAMIYERWLPFLIVPIVAGVIAAVLSLTWRRSAVLFNLSFWVVFFTSAELWRVDRMNAAEPKNPVCVERYSFLHSLTIAGRSGTSELHAAVVTQDGRVALWS